MASSAVVILVVILLVVGIAAAFLMMGGSGSGESVPVGDPAVSLGSVGTQDHPWNSGQGINAFKAKDAKAKWIWVSADGAKTTTVQNVTMAFERHYTSTSAKKKDATLYILADDTASFSFNDEEDGVVGTNSYNNATNPSFPITVLPGVNVLKINVTQNGGAAGLLYTVISGGKVLFHSDVKTYVVDE